MPQQGAGCAAPESLLRGAGARGKGRSLDHIVAHNEIQTATALPQSPEADRRRRMIRYTIAMSIRTLCLIGLVVVPNWTRFIFAAGAVVLPYIAVVLANVGSRGASDPVSPGAPVQLALESRQP